MKLSFSVIRYICHRLTPSLTVHLAFSSISLVDQFGCSLRFCHQEFDNEAISNVKVEGFGF